MRPSQRGWQNSTPFVRSRNHLGFQHRLGVKSCGARVGRPSLRGRFTSSFETTIAKSPAHLPARVSEALEEVGTEVALPASFSADFFALSDGNVAASPAFEAVQQTESARWRQTEMAGPGLSQSTFFYVSRAKAPPAPAPNRISNPVRCRACRERGRISNRPLFLVAFWCTLVRTGAQTNAEGKADIPALVARLAARPPLLLRFFVVLLRLLLLLLRLATSWLLLATCWQLTRQLRVGGC